MKRNLCRRDRVSATETTDYCRKGLSLADCRDSTYSDVVVAGLTVLDGLCWQYSAVTASNQKNRSVECRLVAVGTATRPVAGCTASAASVGNRWDKHPLPRRSPNRAGHSVECLVVLEC